MLYDTDMLITAVKSPGDYLAQNKRNFVTVSSFPVLFLAYRLLASLPRYLRGTVRCHDEMSSPLHRSRREDGLQRCPGFKSHS